MKTKDCRGVLELLGPYLDGELEHERRVSVEEHLKSCPHCRRDLEALLVLHKMAKEKDTGPALADDYWDWHRRQVWKGIRTSRRIEPRSSPRSSFFLFRLGTLAAGAAVVVIAVIGGWRLMQTRPAKIETSADQLETEEQAGGAVGLEKASGAAVRRQSVSPVEEAFAAERGIAEERGGEPAPGFVAGQGAAQEKLTQTGTVGSAGMKDSAASRAKTAERLTLDEISTAESPATVSPTLPGKAVAADSWDIPPRVMAISELPFVSPEDTATVLVRALVESDGSVSQVKVERSSNVQLLDSIAVTNVRQARFSPGLRDGANVQSWVSVPQVFRPVKQRPADVDSDLPPGR